MKGLALVSQDSKPVEVERRDGEPEGLYFRSDRFYKIDMNYYFSTREGIEVGPFGTQSAAAQGLERYIDSFQVSQNKYQAKSAAVSGVWAICNFQ